MSPSPSLPCRAPKRGRLLLVGGFTVPVIVFGSLLGASPALADSIGVTTKTQLADAFSAAPADGSTTTVSIAEPLTGDEGALDALVVPAGADVVLRLAGNEVDLDSITVEDGASLTVQDTGSTAPGLQVGTTASRDASSTDAAGIDLGAGASFRVSQARIDAEGSDGLPGIGQTGSTTDATLSIDGGSAVSAVGGAGAAGIGGGLDAAGLLSVAAYGSDVTATAGPLSPSATTGTAPASAVGHGEGSATGGDSVALQDSTTLHVPAGSTFDVAADTTVHVDYSSEVDLAGSLSGAGSVQNDGSIVPSGSGSVDPDLDVRGNDFLVTFDPNGGTTTAPATKRVYASTLRAGGYALSAETGTSGDESLVSWTPYRDGYWWWFGRDVDGMYLGNGSTGDGTGSAVTLYAQYEHPIVFSGTALKNATLGTKFEQKLPVTGDATGFYTSYYSDDDGDGEGGELGDLRELSPLADAAAAEQAPLAGLPQGLRLNSSTGVVSGYPAQPGHYAFTVYAYSRYQSKQQVVTMDVAGAPVFATSDLADGTAGSRYRSSIVAVGDGDTGTTSYAVTGGRLPAGLDLSSDGVLSGSPTSAGTSTFAVTATNAYGSTKTAFTLQIAAGPVAPSTPVPTASTSTSTSSAPAASTPAPSLSAPPAPSTTSDAPNPTSASASAPAPVPVPSTSTSTSTSTSAAAAPVLPVVAPAEVKLGRQFQLSVAANSTETVTYSIPDGELPSGLVLDAKTGLITGTATTPGHFVVNVTARSASGSTLHAYSIDVPEPTRRITGNIDRVTPKSGQAVKVAVRGLKVGERWTVFVDGKPVQSGVSRFGGSVFRTVQLPRSKKDAEHVITVAGASTSTDPSVLTSARLLATSVTTKKTLKVSRVGTTFSVAGLAAHEKVTVKQGRKRLASGRADDEGVFTFTREGLKQGAHTITATGSTAGRTGALTFTVGR